MRITVRILKFFVNLCLFVLVNSLVGYSQKQVERYALVIGNNKYSTRPLFNCENDADSMAKVLRKELGFKVLLYKNLNLLETRDKIVAFFQSSLNSDVALVYLSGHGMQDRGRIYFVPTDGRVYINQRDSLEKRCLNIQAILDTFAGRNLRGKSINIFIADACRNSPFTTRSISEADPTPDVSGLSIKDGMFVALSTNAGYFADDGENKNGLFTQELLKYIREPIPISEVFRKTKNSVVRINPEQVPNCIDNLSDQFVLTDFTKPSKTSFLSTFVIHGQVNTTEIAINQVGPAPNAKVVLTTESGKVIILYTDDSGRFDATISAVLGTKIRYTVVKDEDKGYYYPDKGVKDLTQPELTINAYLLPTKKLEDEVFPPGDNHS